MELLTLVNDAAKVIMIVMSAIVVCFGVIYLLDLAWNLSRALKDPKRGLAYYFSKRGPENTEESP